MKREALHRPAHPRRRSHRRPQRRHPRPSANKFALLPWEDRAEWEALLNGLIAEHQPTTPTEEFLVHEMARAQWKLNRVAHIEHEIITGQNEASDWAGLAEGWRTDCMYNGKLQKLERNEASLRRAWYKALNTLMKLRGPVQRAVAPKPASEDDNNENRKESQFEKVCRP